MKMPITIQQKPYILGIDQGSSGSRALILDQNGHVHGYGYRPVKRSYPNPDWVEQDPEHVAQTVSEAITIALQQAGCRPDEIAAAGITCQRNTEFVWRRGTREAVGKAISWQDLRTASYLEKINNWNSNGEYRKHLGFYPGPYSTALHLAWRMENDAIFSELARSGEVEVGFSSEWILARLGKLNHHQMDSSLVQATGLYDYQTGSYWGEWLDFLGIPPSILPEVAPTVHEYGSLFVEDVEIPVLAMIGDQQAALLGSNCRTIGQAECTHGTASFVNIFLGNQRIEQDHLNVYPAWNLTGNGVTYCLEADTTVTGAALRWMKEHARFLDDEKEIDILAASVPDAGGVMFLPAFTGLNVPHHDRKARGTILGMSLGTTRAHIARAFLDALGFQLRDIMDTVYQETNLKVERLHVGGGVSASDQACQVQADLTGIQVIRAEFKETTAFAAALLAGFGAGFYSDLDDMPQMPGERQYFDPQISTAQREERHERWLRAVSISRTWGEN